MRIGHPRDQGVKAVEEGSRRAECDQQVHIAALGPQGFPCASIEAGTNNELHRGRERKLQPARQHDSQHGQQQRSAEHRGCDDSPSLPLESLFVRSDDLPVAFDIARPQLGIIASPLHRNEEIGGAKDTGNALD
jgi:hypothetical protein